MIPEAAVEAAVLAIYDHRIPISEDEVRIILDAAAPHMRFELQCLSLIDDMD